MNTTANHLWASRALGSITQALDNANAAFGAINTDLSEAHQEKESLLVPLTEILEKLAGAKARLECYAVPGPQRPSRKTGRRSSVKHPPVS